MAEDLDEVNKRLETIELVLERTAQTSLNASKRMGLFEKQVGKLKVAIKNHPIKGMFDTFKGYAKALSNVTKVTGQHSTMDEASYQKTKKKMTVMQKLTAGMIYFGSISKLNNKIMNNSNNILTRFATKLFALLSVFLIIGFALATLSIAFEGANSPILDMTKDLGPLHDAMQGLLLVITGEGDEGGLATGFDILAAAMLAAGAASLVAGGKFALLTGGLVLAVGAARMFKNEFDNKVGAILLGIGTFMTFIGTVMILKTVFTALAAGTTIALKGTLGVVLAGFGFIIGGVGALVAYMMGAGSGFKGFLLGLLGAIAVGVGLFMVGVAGTIAAPIAAGALLVATIVRYRKQIAELIVRFLGGVKTKGIAFVGGVKDGIIALGAMVVNLIRGIIKLVVMLIKGVIALIVGAFRLMFKGLMAMGKGFVFLFIKLPATMVKGFMSALKAGINLIFGVYNTFARNFSFKIPKVVPKIGGQTIKLPNIPKLAEGGIVTGPTLAMIGDNASGKEAVIPLEKAGQMGFGGGDITVNINVSGVTDRMDKRALAVEIGDMIRDEMSRSLRSHGNRRSGV
ncbi:MAG: hypothetical protein CL581_09280 [Alteromonadaceae bacterium]|nr:hypothetical protein [Alteromonadaceae bacterium]